jgi:DNA-binding transcriptional LysR family regulator
VALAETLNFTRAAERCNVTQPSLTRAIRLLEDELGGPLFHRERNNTHLTELGRTMRPYLEHLWGEITAAKSVARELTRLEDAPLGLGLMCTIGPAKLVELIRGFHARHPGVALRLKDGRAQELEALLVEGELEVALIAQPGELDPRLHGLPLFAERFMITVAPGHRLAGLEAVAMPELAGETYLSRANCEFADHIRGLLEARGIALARPYRSERDDWIQAMTMAGLGFGMTPECAVTTPGIVARPLIEPEVVRTIHLVTVRGRPHSPAVGAFVREAMAWRAKGCPAMGAA